jgi:hypothetical protein
MYKEERKQLSQTSILVHSADQSRRDLAHANSRLPGAASLIDAYELEMNPESEQDSSEDGSVA